MRATATLSPPPTAQGEGIPAQSDAQDGQEDDEDIDLPFAHTVDKRPYVSPTRRSTSRARSKLKPHEVNPTKCKWCKKWGGDGLTHGPPNNIPHSKCNHNEEWDGWRPMYVCRKMNRAYKEREDCKE